MSFHADISSVPGRLSAVAEPETASNCTASRPELIVTSSVLLTLCVAIPNWSVTAAGVLISPELPRMLTSSPAIGVWSMVIRAEMLRNSDVFVGVGVVVGVFVAV